MSFNYHYGKNDDKKLTLYWYRGRWFMARHPIIWEDVVYIAPVGYEKGYYEDREIIVTQQDDKGEFIIWYGDKIYLDDWGRNYSVKEFLKDIDNDKYSASSDIRIGNEFCYAILCDGVDNVRLSILDTKNREVIVRIDEEFTMLNYRKSSFKLVAKDGVSHVYEVSDIVRYILKGIIKPIIVGDL